MLTRFRDYGLIALGTLLQALAMDLFLVPNLLSAGGITGLAQIVNYYTGWPIGVMIILANIPLFILGWKYLGGRRFALRTIATVVGYSVLMDLLLPVLPRNLTNDPVLIALYGGLLNGIGMGLVFRGQGTSGGTDIIARLLGKWRGVPLSQSYLLTDTLIVFGAGLAFSWTKALYAVVVLYISGVAAEIASEGFDVTRVATIVTRQPGAVGQKIMRDLARGVTLWTGAGMYSGETRTILFCAVSRGEVNQLKAIIHEADPAAFVVIGQAHETLGEGFRPLKP
jgi:uncharacterized membrane-anchored protein YitT (DUF2179 family)